MSKKYADKLAYMKMVDQVKMMENDGVLMEESLKSSNGDKVRMYIEQIMLQEETNEYRHRLLVQDAKHIAFVEKSAEDKDKVLHENAHNTKRRWKIWQRDMCKSKSIHTGTCSV